MEIKLFNSLTNRVEPFHEINKGEVTCYVCGPTVYSYVHIGNMRPVVVFDVLRRFFLYLGYKVTFISNFTDIDDKVIKEAKLEKISELEVAEKYIKAFEDNREAVHALKPTYQPRVTKTMDKIIAFIEELIAKGYAYQIDGDVYFRVNMIKDYGVLVNLKIDDLLVGARVEGDSRKESPLDFALWKKTDEGIQFDSPWSKGRPGWHSECVVMINSIVKGGHIDIHGGGFDLKFPHHTNEIAQSEAINGHKIANYWMHNGFINIDDVKMSKSLGNVKLAKDLIQAYGGNVVRFVIINTQYRAPVNFSDEIMESAKKDVDRITQSYQKFETTIQLNGGDLNSQNVKLDMEKYLEALADDLNTANALTEVYRVIKEGNVLLRTRPLDVEKLKSLFFTLKQMLEILGIIIEDKILTDEDKSYYQQYMDAKAKKDFATSDKLRQILIERKVI